jgi:hypothetical protein
VRSTQRNACIAEVRSRPEYALLRPHFNALGTSSFTMAQLADDRIPTPAERHLIAPYFDDASPCAVKAIEAASRLVPAFGPILLQAKSTNEGIMVQLIQGKLTWGGASSAAGL